MSEVKKQHSEQETYTTSFKILPNTYILSPLTCFSKKRLFEELCAVAAAVTGIKSSIFLRALNEREWAGATVCAEGVGMPHAMVPELKQSLAVLAILQDKVPYNAVDSDYAGVDVAFAFFISPKEKYATVANNLRLVSQELENSDFIKALKRSWQDSSKLLLILDKIDQLLSEQVKQPDAAAEVAEGSESPSAASSIMQFISDAITSIGGERDDEEDKESKESKETKAREIAATPTPAPVVAAAVSSIAAAVKSPNATVATLASTVDSSKAHAALAATATMAPNAMVPSATTLNAPADEVLSDKASETTPINTSATASIMQFISEAIGTVGGVSDKDSQRRSTQSVEAVKPSLVVATGVGQGTSGAQFMRGVDANFHGKQANPAIAKRHFAWNHISKPTATTQVMGFINEAIDSTLIGHEPRAASSSEENFPAEAFMRVDEVPLMPPPSANGNKVATAAQGSGLSSIYNETHSDATANAKAKLPPYQPYPYKVKPKGVQSVQVAPAASALTASSATIATAAPLDGESAQALELLLREQLPPTATPEQIQAQLQVQAQLQAQAQAQMQVQLERTMTSNFAHMATPATTTDVTTPASMPSSSVVWPSVTGKEHQSYTAAMVAGFGVTLSTSGAHAVVDGTVMATPLGMFKFDDSMMSQDGPRDGYVEMAMALPAEEAAVAAAIEHEETESGGAMSVLFSQLTSVFSNVMGADKDEDKQWKDQETDKDRSKLSTVEKIAEQISLPEDIAAVTGVTVQLGANKDQKSGGTTITSENSTIDAGEDASAVTEPELSAEELAARAAENAARVAAEAEARAAKAAADAAFAKALVLASIGPRNPNLSVDDILNEDERTAEHRSQEFQKSSKGTVGSEISSSDSLYEHGEKHQGESEAEVDNSDVTILSVDEVLAHEIEDKNAITEEESASTSVQGTKDLSLEEAVEAQLRDIEAVLSLYEQPPYQPFPKDFLSVEKEACESIPFLEGIQDPESAVIESLNDLTIDPEHLPMTPEENEQVKGSDVNRGDITDNGGIGLTVDDLLSLEAEVRSLTFEDSAAVQGLEAIAEVFPTLESSVISAASVSELNEDEEQLLADSVAVEANLANFNTEKEATDTTGDTVAACDTVATYASEDTDDIELTVDDVLEVEQESSAKSAKDDAAVSATENTTKLDRSKFAQTETSAENVNKTTIADDALLDALDSAIDPETIVVTSDTEDTDDIELTVDDVLEIAQEQEVDAGTDVFEATAKVDVAAITAHAIDSEQSAKDVTEATVDDVALAINDVTKELEPGVATEKEEDATDIELTVDDVLEIAQGQDIGVGTDSGMGGDKDTDAVADNTVKTQILRLL